MRREWRAGARVAPLIAGSLGAYAAAALIVVLIVATVMFHNFRDDQGIERHNRING